MKIHIEDLKFYTIIGILDFERLQEQEIVIDLTIDYNYQNKFINYADVSELIKQHIKESKFLLIEDALSSVSKKLKNSFPLINTLYIRLSKPSILADCNVSVSNLYNFNS